MGKAIVKLNGKLDPMLIPAADQIGGRGFR